MINVDQELILSQPPTIVSKSEWYIFLSRLHRQLIIFLDDNYSNLITIEVWKYVVDVSGVYNFNNIIVNIFVTRNNKRSLPPAWFVLVALRTRAYLLVARWRFLGSGWLSIWRGSGLQGISAKFFWFLFKWGTPNLTRSQYDIIVWRYNLR